MDDKKIVIYDPEGETMLVLPYQYRREYIPIPLSEKRSIRAGSTYTKGSTAVYYGPLSRFSEMKGLDPSRQHIVYEHEPHSRLDIRFVLHPHDREIIMMRSSVMKHSDQPCIVDVWVSVRENVVNDVFITEHPISDIYLYEQIKDRPIIDQE